MQPNVSFISACRQKQTDPGEMSWKLATLPGTIVFWINDCKIVPKEGFIAQVHYSRDWSSQLGFI